MNGLSLSLAAGLLAVPEVLAQGSFIFGNRPSAIGGTGAPVMVCVEGGVMPAIGPDWLAQVVVAGVPVSETIVSFGRGAAAGFIPNMAVRLEGASPGSTVSVQLAAWHSGLGATYAVALAQGIGGAMASAAVNVTLKEPTDPTLNPMVGLQPFMIFTPACIPEPGLPALAALGIFVLAGFRSAASGRRPVP